jgi:CxxC motif-containing protein (DUF1111 family)
MPGEELFKRDWQRNDPLCPEGDGLGPVYNATSCVACHHQGGVGGSGGLKHNVTTFSLHRCKQLVKEGVVHSFGWQPAESRKTPLRRLRDCISAGRVVDDDGCIIRYHVSIQLSQQNTPALFGARLIDEIPERVILAGARNQRLKWGMAKAGDESAPVGRASRVADGRVGRFGWKGQMASLSDFVRAACANELGLGNPSHAQAVPLFAPNAKARGLDLTEQQCDQLTAFCASLPHPVERRPADVTEAKVAEGKKLFAKVGCADCHTPKLGSVKGIYSDLLLHDMGQELAGGGGDYGRKRQPDSKEELASSHEWRTPPLWGVADSAPYLHDGRAATLKEAIKLHGGQGTGAARQFAALTLADQAQVLAFLTTLRAP